jgi:uncharacterized membrane protein YdjX (TVP38/TMEM64 family)
MTRLWLKILLIPAILLALYFVVELVDVPLLKDPRPWVEGGGYAAAAIGILLLLADIAIPVPSSIIMLAMGAVYGPVTGGLINTIGGWLATMTGFLIGRSMRAWVPRVTGEAERARAIRFLERWGIGALIATRPVPLIAETMAIVAGASTMSGRSVAAAALLGGAPAGFLYSYAGAQAGRISAGLASFLVVIGLSVLFSLFTVARNRR